MAQEIVTDTPPFLMTGYVISIEVGSEMLNLFNKGINDLRREKVLQSEKFPLVVVVFLKIINTANNLGAEYIHFGSRQDILFPVKERNKNALDETFRSINTEYEVNEFFDICISNAW